MRLTVLGSSASFAGAGRACAGYLVEGAGAKVLFDCGNGVLSNLAQVLDPLEIDAIFVSHYHPDHFLDLFALQAALRYAPSGPAAPMPLYLPQGLFDRMRCLLSERGANELVAAFEVTELADGAAINVAGMTVTPVAVEHTEPTFALRAEADGAVLAYSADASATDHVVQALRGAHTALAEATLPQEYEGAAPHLTAAQAGRYAREAGVERLILTHIWPTSDRALSQREASEAFGAPVEIAEELATFDIERREETP